jgi:histidine triad (HIT) family protein
MVDTESVKWQREDWHCQVVNGTFPVERIYENDEAIAFWSPPGHDLNDQYETHIYVIPKRHIATLLDLKPEHAAVMQGLLEAIQTVSRQLGLDERGFFIRANVMPPYQHTGHIHLHLLSGEREGQSG